MLCGQRVVPALFVFSVLGTLIAQGAGPAKLCALFPRWGTEAAVLLLGLFGGVPLGPLTALELYRSGGISKRQGEYLCCFSCTPSLSFIISFGGELLGKAAATRLAVLTVVTAVITALIFKPLMLEKNNRQILPVVMINAKPFSAVLASSAASAVVICGCVVFFGCMAEMLPKAIGGFLEISSGISNCKSLVEAAFLLGFSGISILCQTAALCGDELSVAPCVCAKLFQSVFMGICAYFLLT